MAECFCGCGKRTPIGARSLNRIGNVMRDDIATVKTLMGAGMRSPRGQEFVEVSTTVCHALTDTVHTGVRPTERVHSRARALIAYGRAHFSGNAVADAVRRSGLSTVEATQALRHGRFDPYADVPPLP